MSLFSHPLWDYSHIQFIQCADCNLSQWRPLVLAYKIDKEKDQTRPDPLFLFTPSGVVVAMLLWGFFTVPHWLLKHRSEYKRVHMDLIGSSEQVSSWETLWVERRPLNVLHCPLVWFWFQHLRLWVFSRSPTRVCFPQCAPFLARLSVIFSISLSVLYIVHISLCVALKNLGQEQPSPTIPLGSNKIENKQTG